MKCCDGRETGRSLEVRLISDVSLHKIEICISAIKVVNLSTNHTSKG